MPISTGMSATDQRTRTIHRVCSFLVVRGPWSVRGLPRVISESFSHFEALSGDHDNALAIATLRLSSLGVQRLLEFLRGRLRVERVDPKKVNDLLPKLDDDKFDVRERASQELERLGPGALPAIEKAPGEQQDIGGVEKSTHGRGR